MVDVHWGKRAEPTQPWGCETSVWARVQSTDGHCGLGLRGVLVSAIRGRSMEYLRCSISCGASSFVLGPGKGSGRGRWGGGGAPRWGT